MKNIFLFILFFLFFSSTQAFFFESYDETNSVIIEGPGNRRFFNRCLNLLSWNIHKAQKAEELKANLKSILESINIDIWALQETTYNKKMLKIYKSLGKENEIVTASTFSILNQNRYAGVSTISSVSSLEQIPIFSSREFGFLTKKIALITKYLFYNGEQFYVVNIHAINFVGIQSFKIQILTILKFFESIQNPIIFLGDFNTWGKNRLHFLKKEMAKRSYQDAFSMFTNNLKDSRTQTPFLGKIFTYFQNPLDHVFVRGLNIKNFNILSGFKSSDHFPLYLRVCLPNEEQKLSFKNY